MKVGNIISSIRKERGLKQIELARKAGISKSYMSQIENDKKIPDTEILEAISNSLGLPLPILLLRGIVEEDIPSGNKKQIMRDILPTIENLTNYFLKKT